MLTGALITASLIAVLFLARQLAGVPFVPFDVFDWIGRVLPGGVVTFGIDAIVDTIRGLNLGETSTVAKTAEQTLAIAGLGITGIVAGVVLFAWLRRRQTGRGYLAGTLLGLAIGVPVMLISLEVNRTAPAGALPSSIWILLVFGAWGAAIAWVHHRLSGAPAADDPAPQIAPIDRRRFMVRLGAASATITLAGAGLGTWAAQRARDARLASRADPWSATGRLPNAGSAVAPVTGTRPEFTPVDEHYRVDINTRPPIVSEAEWRLRIGGLVEQPLELTLDELRGYPLIDGFITLECISNRVAGDLISTQRWTGVSLQTLLPDLRIRAGATHLRIRSVDGFHETVALADVRDDERIMLAYAWDGLPLPAEHGFPLRIHIPDRFGMKQPKWIESIEAIDAWEPGYWVQRGWDLASRSAGGRRSMAGGGAARAALRPDLGGLALRVAVLAGTTHVHRALPGGRRYPAGSRGYPRAARRRDGAPFGDDGALSGT